MLVTTWLRTLHPESNFKYHDSLGSLETALTSSMLRMCVDSFSAYVIELNGHTWSIRSLLEQFCFFTVLEKGDLAIKSPRNSNPI